MLYRLFFGQNKNRNQYKDYSLFCPFAYRMLEGPILAKDLAVEYKYLANTSEWFYIARKNAERVIRNMTSLTKGKETQCNFSATTPTTRRLYVPFTDSVSLTTSRNRLFFFSVLLSYFSSRETNCLHGSRHKVVRHLAPFRLRPSLSHLLVHCLVAADPPLQNLSHTGTIARETRLYFVNKSIRRSHILCNTQQHSRLGASFAFSYSLRNWLLRYIQDLLLPVT